MFKIAPDKSLPQTKNRGQRLTLTVARGKPIMMDWQSRDDDRNADPDWQADWQCGHEIGLLIVGGLALVKAIVSALLGAWETPIVAALYKSLLQPS